MHGLGKRGEISPRFSFGGSFRPNVWYVLTDFPTGNHPKRNTVSVLTTMTQADSSSKIDLPPLVPSPAQVRQARAAIRMGQRELAKLAGVAVTTLNAYEREDRPAHGSTVVKLRAALNQLGFTFDDEGNVRLANRPKP